MNVKYDHDNKFVTYECPVCKYTHKEYYSSKTSYTDEDKLNYGRDPFIEGEVKFIHTESVDYAPDRVRQRTVYVCPRCGVMQLNTDWGY